MENLSPSTLAPNELPEGFTTSFSSATDATSNKATEQQLQREAIIEAALTSEALERLKRIKLVKAEKASKVESVIISMAMQGKLSAPINEGKLIEMIEGMGAVSSGAANAGTCGRINIQRKRNTLDSDDEDNDDDLL